MKVFEKIVVFTCLLLVSCVRQNKPLIREPERKKSVGKIEYSLSDKKLKVVPTSEKGACYKIVVPKNGALFFINSETYSHLAYPLSIFVQVEGEEGLKLENQKNIKEQLYYGTAGRSCIDVKKWIVLTSLGRKMKCQIEPNMTGKRRWIMFSWKYVRYMLIEQEP